MNLDGFPSFTLVARTTLHRIHRARNAPWWFSSDGSGRFDPMARGLGTCYLAETDLGAWVEVFRTALVIAERDVHDRRLCSPALARDLLLADATNRRALAFGVTASLGAGEDYEPSREFAGAAVAAGFSGVRYFLRHDPSQSRVGIAVFGPAGAVAVDDPDRPSGPDVEIPKSSSTRRLTPSGTESFRPRSARRGIRERSRCSSSRFMLRLLLRRSVPREEPWR